MNYSAIKNYDIASGPGVRVSLYVSGCRRRCKGCFNPETWDFGYGHLFDETVEYEIMEALAPSYIKGFSLLGGEPFEPENAQELAGFLEKVKTKFPDKQIWCYTGYDFETDLMAKCQSDGECITNKSKADYYRAKMLDNIDVLVDGEFVEADKIIDLRFRGSVNQRIIDIKASMESGKVVLWQDLYD